MEKNKYLAISALGFFLNGLCGDVRKNQAALVGCCYLRSGWSSRGSSGAHNGICSTAT